MSACLALVRPVGMTDQAATEWLAVAAAEVRDMPRSALEAGCREARQTCTHHGQIVPTILKHKPQESMALKYASDWDAALADYRKGYPAIGNTGSGAKRIGQVVSLPRPE